MRHYCHSTVSKLSSPKLFRHEGLKALMTELTVFVFLKGFRRVRSGGAYICTCVYGIDKTITTVTGRQNYVVYKALHGMTSPQRHCQCDIIPVSI